MSDPYSPVEPRNRYPSPAYLVEGLRQAVADWRKAGYPGASETSLRLLHYWFDEEHIADGGTVFRFFYCQREAIETLIYCHEIEQARDFFALSRKFGNPKRSEPFVDSRNELFPRYVFKIATGAGKTKIMALAIVWSYFHKLHETKSPLTTNFLLLAPNVIVYDRLRFDFEEGRIFDTDPLIPPEWRPEWDLKVVMRDDSVSEERRGMLFLTNIQHLYEREDSEPANPVTALLGPKAAKEIAVSTLSKRDIIKRYPRLLVLNDEGHHVHDEELKWSEIIKELHDSSALAARLDFSATPKTQDGTLFPWIIVDYPLVEAIEAGIVKKPILGKVTNAKERMGKTADVRYRPWILAAVNRWREYWKKLHDEVPNARERRKPVLFVMASSTKEADEIADYLKQQPDFKMRGVLVIHTDTSGDISKAELPALREKSRTIDRPDNPCKAIVSVLMLREGWDVKNVIVILGLRPYTAKADILPEQTIGRGLRLMEGPASGYDETVDVIGTPALVDRVKELEKEGVKFKEVDLRKERVQVASIFVDGKKLKRDIWIPQLTPRIRRRNVDFSKIVPAKLKRWDLTVGTHRGLEKLHYEGRWIARDGEGEIAVRRTWTLPIPETAPAVVSFYTTKILREAHLPGHFNELLPLVEEYLESYFFKEAVDLAMKPVLQRLSEDDVMELAITTFTDAIKKLTLLEEEVKVAGEPLRLSETRAYPWSRPTCMASKTLFNRVACHNQLELDFALFLENARDVVAFSKLVAERTRFRMEYLCQGVLRLYYPDFVVRTKDGFYIVETKGREDIDVALKDQRAKRWCEDASRLTGKQWHYIKITEDLFRDTRARTFKELAAHQLVRDRSR